MRKIFDGCLNVQWHRPSEKLPLDDHFKMFPWSAGNWGVVTYVFILWNDEEDRNEDPEVGMGEFLCDHNGDYHWSYIGGHPFSEDQLKRIKFWAEVPNYEKRTVENYTRRILPTCDKFCIEEGCDCEE